MDTIYYSIISEEMVWIWYYDSLGSKHLKELLGNEARGFVTALGDQDKNVVKEVPVITVNA